MSGFFKLFCDISVYYALIFYLAKAIMDVDFFAAGWFFMILMCACRGVLQEKRKDENPFVRSVYLIPLLSFLFAPSLIQAALMMPLWIWCIYSFESGTYDFTYQEFRSLCSKQCIVMFLCYLSLFFLPQWPYALTGAAFYLCFALGAMVINLRYLRQDKTGGKTSFALITGATGVSGVLAYFHVFAFAGSLLKRVYLWLVSQLFKVVTPETLSFMDDIRLPDAGDVEMGGIPVPSEGNHAVSLIAPLKEMSLFEKILIILLIAVLCGVIIGLVLRGMKGHRFYQRGHNEDTVEKIKVRRKERPSLFAPSDPRLAVRWYYAKYVRECVKKGLLTKDNVNSEDVSAASVLIYDENLCRDFRDLYIRVRYSSEPVSRQDVNLARSFWKEIKNNR